MSIRSYSTTAANNNSAPPNGAPEGMAPSGVNNVIRQIMADMREWYESPRYIDYGDTPTRVDNDTFTVATDLTARYPAGTRLKLVGATTGYGVVTSASYSAPNTSINVAMASGNVPTSLSTVSIDFLFAGDYNVLNYGNNIVPGTTDMSAAITAAITACPEGGEVIFPKIVGDYRIATGVALTKGIKLRGIGFSNTGVNNYPTLIGDAGINILTIGSASGVSAEVSGLAFKNGARGIVFTQFAHYCLIDKVRFDSQTTCAFCDDEDPAGTYIGNVLSNFEITSCARAFKFNRVYNQFLFEKGRVTGCTEIAVNLKNENPSHMSNLIFDFVVFESNQKNVFDVNGCVVTVGKGCHFEDNGSAGDGGATIYADFVLRQSTGGSPLKTSLVMDRSFFSTAHTDQADERIHIEGPNVYVSLREVGRPSGSKIKITNANVTGVDLFIHDDPEAAGNWDIDALITDVIQITPAAGRLRIGGEGFRFKDNTVYQRILRATDTYDWPDIAVGASAERSFTVSGVSRGDLVDVGIDANLGGMMKSASADATDTIRVVMFNPPQSSGAVNLGSATHRFYVWKEA